MSQPEEQRPITQYICAQCGRTPRFAKEVFQGCICGHRLFRIITSKPKSLINNKEIHVCEKHDPDFLLVREHEIGIYSINVEQMLVKEPSNSKLPLIAGNEGIYSIFIQKKRKK